MTNKPQDSSKTRIIFWGTSEFALPSLEALIRSGYKPALVITNPDKPSGRKHILTSPPVKIMAEKYNLPVLQPQNFKKLKLSPYGRSPEGRKIPAADLFIIAAYGKIIPKEILAIPKRGALNIHPSLLPRWRGPSPIQYAILNGDKETGVSIMLADELMDHGPVLAQQKICLPGKKFAYPELHDILASIGAAMLIEILPKYLKAETVPAPQDHSRATYSKIIKKDDGRIDWSRRAEDIERMIRAFTPWPGAWTIWQTGRKSCRVRIEEADTCLKESPSGLGIGQVWQDGDAAIFVKTGLGSLTIKKLTLESKKTLDAAAFLRGYADIRGSVLR